MSLMRSLFEAVQTLPLGPQSISPKKCLLRPHASLPGSAPQKSVTLSAPLAPLTAYS